MIDHTTGGLTTFDTNSAQSGFVLDMIMLGMIPPGSPAPRAETSAWRAVGHCLRSCDPGQIGPKASQRKSDQRPDHGKDSRQVPDLQRPDNPNQRQSKYADRPRNLDDPRLQ